MPLVRVAPVDIGLRHRIVPRVAGPELVPAVGAGAIGPFPIAEFRRDGNAPRTRLHAVAPAGIVGAAIGEVVVLAEHVAELSPVATGSKRSRRWRRPRFEDNVDEAGDGVGAVLRGGAVAT